MNNTAIIPGSISAISTASGKSLAESFLNCDIVTIIDVSGSMNTHDSRNNQSRYDVACEELAHIQKANPGKIAVVSFSDTTQFCPGGIPIMQGDGTKLAHALAFVKVADVPGMRFILVSDGRPDNEQEALNMARTFKNKIDVIYVGPEGDTHGAQFLAQLSAATGGTQITIDRARELKSGFEKLLLKG